MNSGPYKSNSHDQQDSSLNVFDNPELFAEKFDGAGRDEWQKPDEVIKTFNLDHDATVVEIGSGTGYFVVRLAKQLEYGEVYAIEQAPKMADYLRGRINELRLNNVQVRNTVPGGSLNFEKHADLIFSVDVYHHIQDRVSYFAEARGYLKPEGSVVVIDRTEQTVEGQPKGHRVLPATVKAEMQEAGFELSQELDLLLPIQYYLAFKRKK